MATTAPAADSATVDLAAAGLHKWLPSTPDASARLSLSIAGAGAVARGARLPLSLFDVGADDPVVKIDDTTTPPGVFSVAAFDPDAPRPSFLHWLLCDAPAVDPARGATVVPWMPPAPPGGVHRYCFALFRQRAPGGGRAAKAGWPPAAPKARAGWQPKAFAEAHGATLVDATWFSVSAREEEE